MWLLKFCFTPIWFRIPHYSVKPTAHVAVHVCSTLSSTHCSHSDLVSFPIGGSFCHGLALKATHTTDAQPLWQPSGSEKKPVYPFWSLLHASFSPMGGWGDPHHPKQKNSTALSLVWIHFYKLKKCMQANKNICLIMYFAMYVSKSSLQLMWYGAENTYERQI